MNQNEAEIEDLEFVHFKNDYLEECDGNIKRYLEVLNQRSDEEKEHERKIHDMISAMESQHSELSDTIRRLAAKQVELRVNIREMKKQAASDRLASALNIRHKEQVDKGL